MEHLTHKPFYLTDEDILWVGDTLAGMSEGDRIARLLYAPGHKLPLSPVVRTRAQRISGKQKEGFAAYVYDFPGDEVDERDRHRVEHINTMTCDKWDETFGASYRDCIEAGVMAVMVEPILFPAYSHRLASGREEQPAVFAHELTTLLLKQVLGFNGLVIAEHIKSEDMPRAIAAGCDMLFSTINVNHDLQCIRQGLGDGVFSQERLREAVVQILGIEAALGLHK
ncbi:MAG: hypothetical protein FWB88_11315 [Defluviitaleaceae bacterium]|nr:hypothetical protein [Defluviitaleaceae bacterium]MCL2240422.1 hypothetical protein [Defluviitaleaceae bacterium]